MVKAAMNRNGFRSIEKCIHFGSTEDKEGDTPEYKKVRMIVKHIQDQFSQLFVSEQTIIKAIIKYFGKSGLEQAIRNKPMWSGFKAWLLATISRYVVTFGLYQGRGVGENHSKNVAAVSAAAATLLVLVDLLPEEKKTLLYHFLADNYFSSLKLVDKLSANKYLAWAIRMDRLKGKPPLTPVEKFKKQERGYHETENEY
jgi:hypothetical protein